MVSAITYCGQQLLDPKAGGFTCTLAQGHVSEFHMDVQAVATWSTAGDLVVHSDGRQAAARRTGHADHVMCAHEVNELRKQVTGRGETIAKLRNALARTGPCCCADAGEGNLDLDDLCPRHGTVAELVRQLKWAHHFTATIEAACPVEITEPFSGYDVAQWVAERLAGHDTLDAVRAVLREAGLGFAPPADDVHELAGQRKAHAEHAKNAEDALTRIADLARQALDTVGSGSPYPLITFQRAMGRIVAVTEEKDR